MTRRLHIVHVAWEYPPRIVGGLGVHVAALAREQVRRGHAVWVLTVGRRQRRVDGVQVLGAGTRPVPEGGPFLWQIERMAGQMVRRGLGLQRPGEASPLVVHAHDWLVGPAALRLAREWRAPLVVTFHATELGRSGASARRDADRATVVDWEARLAQGADAVVVLSGASAEEARRLGARHPVVIPGGFHPVAAAARRPVPGRFFTAARLVPEKGLDVLLRALALIPHATLEVAGAGPLGAQLDAEARRLGLERRVRFWGRLGPAQLAARRRTAWAYVQPSRYEPFGLAALDAAGDGMPLVFSRVGGLAEWGRLVPVRWARPGDATDLARQMTAALLDQDWGCAEAGQRLAVLAWPQVAERMDTVYGPLVEEREGAGPAHGSGFGS